MLQRNAFSICVLYLLGTSIIYLGSHGYHSHIAMLSAFILFIPFLFLIKYLLNKYEEKNLFEMIGEGIFGIALKILIIIYCFFLGGRDLFRYVDFITTTSLFMGNNILLILSIMIICLFITRAGIRAFGRIGQVCFFIVAISLLFLSSLGISDFDVNNLLPLYPVYLADYLKNFVNFFVEPFFESFLLINIFCYVKEKKIFTGYIIGLLILLIIISTSMMLLGDTFMTKIIFPYFSSISVINGFDFLNRIEVFGIIIFYLSCVIKLGVIIISIALGISDIVKIKEKKRLMAPIIIFIALISFLFKNTRQMRFINPYYLGGGFVIALITLLFLLVRRKQQN